VWEVVEAGERREKRSGIEEEKDSAGATPRPGKAKQGSKLGVDGCLRGGGRKEGMGRQLEMRCWACWGWLRCEMREPLKPPLAEMKGSKDEVVGSNKVKGMYATVGIGCG
jgi:hypothetical protein